MNRATIDVQAHLRAQSTALQQYTKEFLATRAAIRVCLLGFAFFLKSSMGARQRTHWV